jgi:DNA adenine methylase
LWRGLVRVTIENLDWRSCFAVYDRPHTLFYVDPPYYGVEDYYGRGIFAREDFAELASLLGAIQGRFILSLNDVPEVRKLFRAFHRLPVTTRYSVRPLPDGGVGARELLVSNVPFAKSNGG